MRPSVPGRRPTRELAPKAKTEEQKKHFLRLLVGIFGQPPLSFLRDEALWTDPTVCCDHVEALAQKGCRGVSWPVPGGKQLPLHPLGSLQSLAVAPIFGRSASYTCVHSCGSRDLPRASADTQIEVN